MYQIHSVIASPTYLIDDSISGPQVLFSSVAALLGSAGQSCYSAANSSLDGLAAKWAKAGAPTRSLQWGAWAGAGMAARDTSTAARIQRAGMSMVTPMQGLAALGSVMAASAKQSAPVTAAIPFDWQRFMLQQHVVEPHMFDEYSQLPPQQGSQVSVADGASRGNTISTIKQGIEQMTEIVQSAVRSVLGAEVTSSEPLMAAGNLNFLLAHKYLMTLTNPSPLPTRWGIY